MVVQYFCENTGWSGLGIYDTNGNQLVPIGLLSNRQRDVHQNVSNGLLGVRRQDIYSQPDEQWQWDFVNTLGEVIIPGAFGAVRSFNEGIAAVALITSPNSTNRALHSHTFKWAFIDSTGQQITEFIFDDARNFSNGMAAVAQYNEYGKKLWGFINTAGEVVVQPQFCWVSSFNEGFAVVNRGADEVYSPLYRHAPMRLTGTHAIGGQFMLIDRWGRAVLDLSDYDAVGFHVSEGVLAVNQGRRLSDGPMNRYIQEEGVWGFIRLVY